MRYGLRIIKANKGMRSRKSYQGIGCLLFLCLYSVENDYGELHEGIN